MDASEARCERIGTRKHKLLYMYCRNLLEMQPRRKHSMLVCHWSRVGNWRLLSVGDVSGLIRAVFGRPQPAIRRRAVLTLSPVTTSPILATNASVNQASHCTVPRSQCLSSAGARELEAPPGDLSEAPSPRPPPRSASHTALSGASRLYLGPQVRPSI